MKKSLKSLLKQRSLDISLQHKNEASYKFSEKNFCTWLKKVLELKGLILVRDLRDMNSVGIDDTSLRFVRDSLPVMAVYYTVIINTSIVTGKYPPLWKHHLINSAFKSGDFDEVGNFRPIALLPVLSKILEKVVAMQLMDHLKSNNLLSNTQHGFCPKLSTETALLDVTNTIYDNNEDNLLTMMIPM